jgi:hypothetical protein
MWRLLLTLVGLLAPAEAQELISPQLLDHVNELFDRRLGEGSLKCHVRSWGPLLAFNQEYKAGFVISPNMAQLSLGEKLVAYLRVTPEQRDPVLLTVNFDLPVSLPSVPTGQPFNFGLAGEFAVGEGRYTVELLLVDEKGRGFYDQWRLKTGSHTAASPLKPLTVSPLLPDSWDGKLDPKGVRLTALLDATESSPNPARLRPSTSDYLLNVLATILRQVPCRSVKVVAFNLDTQKDVFSEDHLDGPGFTELARALRDVNTGVVSYPSLRPCAWQDFLLAVVQNEASAPDPPDAVVFIGAATHFVDKPTTQKVEPVDRKLPLFFYLEYFAVLPVFPTGSDMYRGDYRRIPDDNGAAYAPEVMSGFPDAIDQLTRQLHGAVFRITSSKDVGPAVQRILAKLTSPGTRYVLPHN